MGVEPKIKVFPPKSSILIGFSIINHPFWGTPIFGNTQIYVQSNLRSIQDFRKIAWILNKKLPGLNEFSMTALNPPPTRISIPNHRARAKKLLDAADGFLENVSHRDAFHDSLSWESKGTHPPQCHPPATNKALFKGLFEGSWWLITR